MRRNFPLVGVVFALFAAIAGAADLRVTVSQSFLDKVLKDLFDKGPYVVVDEENPFEPSMLLAKEPLSFGELRERLSKQKSRDRDEEELLRAINSETEKIERELENLEKLRGQAKKEGKAWGGPSIEETERIEKLDFPVKVHVAHVKVVIPQRPSIRLNGVRTPFADLLTDLDLRFQIYWKNPFHDCTKECCVIWCFCCEWDSGWEPLNGRIPFSTQLKSEGTLNFSIIDPNLVMTPNFTKLRINHPIWGLIPLEGIANNKVKPIELLNKEDVVIDLDELGLEYEAAKLAVGGGSNELYLEAEMKKD